MEDKKNTSAVHDVPSDELSEWQATQDFVRHEKILYVLVEDDAQAVAQQKHGRELTDHELVQVKKGLHEAFGQVWTEVMEDVVCFVVREL